MREDGSISIDLKIYVNDINTHLKDISKNFSNNLHEYFSASEGVFEDSDIQFSIENMIFNNSKEFKSVSYFGKSESLICYKAKNDQNFSIVLETMTDEQSKVPQRIINDIISDSISECLFSDAIEKPFVITSERTGIALFYKELDINKNKIIEHLTDGDDINVLALLNSMRSRYAMPIQDNINIVRDYENISKKKSFIKEDKKYKYVLDSLNDLLGGSFKAVDKQVLYRPKKERGRAEVNVPVYIASSSIKSMFLIDLYINCLAKKNGMLIIDEPELNLHPDNQRKMAGLLARLVNAGTKVIITTHSDYLIREINNRIMLSSDFPQKEEIISKQKNPKMCQEDILRVEQVKAYTMEKHTIKPVEIDKYGIKMDIFDSMISEANDLSDDIYFAIEEANDSSDDISFSMEKAND